MSAGQFWLLLLLLLLILGVVGLPWLLGRRREAESWDAPSVYLSAIDALIRGRRHQAMSALRRLARQETENMAVYLRLGDLLRVMGHPEKAQRIHAGLAARPAGDPELMLEIRESLLEDLMAQEQWEEVIRLAESIRASDRRNLAAHRALTFAHEARREWGAALVALDEWERLTPSKTVPNPVQLRLHVARRYLQAGQTKDSRKLLEEALRMDGTLSASHVLLGDVFAQEGDHEKAVEHWLDYARAHPGDAGRIFDRLERSYFEMGRFGDLLQIYESLSQQSPPSVPAILALAEMHRRRGRPEEAIHLLRSLLATEQDSRAARRLLIRSLLQSGRTPEALQELDALLDALPKEREALSCPRCHQLNQELDPKCSHCGAWMPAGGLSAK